MFYVYVLKSTDEKEDVYIGHTANLKGRVDQHNSSSNRGYTKGQKWQLVYYEAYSSAKDSRRREKRLKDDGRAKRQLLNRIEGGLTG
jgi:predicted GIY-YIG superfamily endonuclease